jgi:aspartate/methionine/tyrosine aminotransferase
MRDFALEVFFARWEFAAKHHMTASDAQSMTMAELLELANPHDRTEFDNLWLGYTETRGAGDLRAAIANTYDTMGSANIQCFAGAEEGIYVAMRVLLQPEDHAIVLVPNYQAAETIPLDRCEVSGVPLLEDQDWRPDLDALRDAIRPNTKLVSINFPNNPTGAIPSHDDFASLVEICREHDLYLFSDEVYRGLEVDESRRIPQAADVYEKAFSLNVMSKAYGLPGLRVGWIASQDMETLTRFEHYKHYLSICNSAPSERLALIALKARVKILARNLKIVRENLRKLDVFFARYPDLFEWKAPDGGCVAYPRYTGPGTAQHFCERLVNETGALLLPASIYKSELMETSEDRFRIGCGRLGIDEGLDAIRDFLAANRA